MISEEKVPWVKEESLDTMFNLSILEDLNSGNIQMCHGVRSFEDANDIFRKIMSESEGQLKFAQNIQSQFLIEPTFGSNETVIRNTNCKYYISNGNKIGVEKSLLVCDQCKQLVSKESSGKAWLSVTTFTGIAACNDPKLNILLKLIFLLGK